MVFWSALFNLFGSEPMLVSDVTAPATPPVQPIYPNLDKAFKAVAPNVDPADWIQVLSTAFDQYYLTSKRQVAAALGQFSEETGFTNLIENLYYTHAERIRAVFPREFPTLASAQAAVGNPQLLANIAYAHKLGNGDIASGDGWRFRGRGLIQLTGRDEYTAFAKSMLHLTPEEASAYCGTHEGAAMSGCWYLQYRKCIPLMDAWNIDGVTRLVNGSAILGAAKRKAASEAALKALGGS